MRPRCACGAPRAETGKPPHFAQGCSASAARELGTRADGELAVDARQRRLDGLRASRTASRRPRGSSSPQRRGRRSAARSGVRSSPDGARPPIAGDAPPARARPRAARRAPRSGRARRRASPCAADRCCVRRSTRPSARRVRARSRGSGRSLLGLAPPPRARRAPGRGLPCGRVHDASRSLRSAVPTHGAAHVDVRLSEQAEHGRRASPARRTPRAPRPRRRGRPACPGSRTDIRSAIYRACRERDGGGGRASPSDSSRSPSTCRAARRL